MTRLLQLLFLLSLFIGSAWAQDNPTQEELDRLLAPIALYPDDLLAMTLMASTYPLEVVEASRWVEQNKKLTGDALDKKLKEQKWDPSVVSLCKTPDVLKRLNENLEWTQKLGNAFLADQAAVMDTVQSLRKKALDSGNLKNSKEMKVDTNTSADPAIIVIQSPDPQVIYVPTYNPTVVYGTWWYPYPPYYIYPPAYVYPPGFGFTMGIFVGAWFWGGCHWGYGWGHSNVNININHYNKVNNVHINNGTWNHNAEHRKGVAYPNDNVAQKFNRASDRQAIQNREAFRGKIDTMDTAALKDRANSLDTSKLQNMDRSNLQNKASSFDRSSSSGSRDNAFSHVGNTARTHDISSRGSFSRGSMGGGMRRGR